MQSNFNSLQKKTAKMSGNIFDGQKVVLGTVCSTLLSTFNLVRKCQFCVFNESTDNSQVDSVISTALHALCSDMCWTHSNRCFVSIQNKCKYV